jgi:hypothetical protein
MVQGPIKNLGPLVAFHDDGVTMLQRQRPSFSFNTPVQAPRTQIPRYQPEDEATRRKWLEND